MLPECGVHSYHFFICSVHFLSGVLQFLHAAKFLSGILQPKMRVHIQRDSDRAIPYAEPDQIRGICNRDSRIVHNSEAVYALESKIQIDNCDIKSKMMYRICGQKHIGIIIVGKTFSVQKAGHSINRQRLCFVLTKNKVILQFYLWVRS